MIMLLWSIEPKIEWNRLLTTIESKNLVGIMILSNSATFVTYLRASLGFMTRCRQHLQQSFLEIGWSSDGSTAGTSPFRAVPRGVRKCRIEHLNFICCMRDSFSRDGEVP